MKYGKIEGNDFDKLIMNNALNAFRIEIVGNLTLQNMIDQVTDEYEDENGVNLPLCLNITYNGDDDYFSMSEGDTTGIDTMEYATTQLAREAYVGGGNDGFTKLLLHFNGVDGAKATNDNSASNHTITFYNDAQLDDSQKKFGATSIYFDGAGDYITASSSSDFDLAGTDFTIDFWIRFYGSIPNGSTPVCRSWTNGWFFQSWGSFQFYSGSSYESIPFDTLSANTWYHVALVYVGGVANAYLDGILKNSVSMTVANGSGDLYFGRLDGTEYYFSGHIDEFRISKGIARWTSNFTPPTAAYESIVVYSEDTIKQQGSYSLKISAPQTDSLNQTITKTFSPTLDLSNRDVIRFWARASRAGTNFQIQMHDSGGTSSSGNVTIATENVWEVISWDISGITSTDRDAINQITFKIVNADSINTIYLDDLYSYSNATGLTLISENSLAEAVPEEGRLVILMEEINAITLNTDLKAYVSRDDGTTFTQITLTDKGDFGNNIKVLYGYVDISGQPSDTDMVYKLQTFNSKNCKLHGTDMSWR